MSNSKRELLLAPTAADGVNIATANTTAFNLDVNVVVAKGLGLELVLVELGPGLGAVDLEAGELFGDRHVGDCVRMKQERQASDNV